MSHKSGHIIIQQAKALVTNEHGTVRPWVKYAAAFVSGAIVSGLFL